MKTLKSIARDVLKKIFPETVHFGFRSKNEFFDHTMDISRRVENLYSNIARGFIKKYQKIKPYTIAVRFEVWGMELGRVAVPLVVTASNEASDNKALRRNLIDLICECDRIKQTDFAPTHVIVLITANGDKWEKVHREFYYLEKWQSEEIVNGPDN